jgi:hypothetical protein
LKTESLTFNSGKYSLLVNCSDDYEFFFQEFVISGLQDFINAIPELNPREPFYFGLWRVCIFKHDDHWSLFEWSFAEERFLPTLGKSLWLWYEQSSLAASQDISWYSTKLDQFIYVTPTVFENPANSTLEGARDVPTAPESSGWFIYTDADRKANLSFERISLADALQIYDMNILRFLGLPVGWMFNIETNGASHVWEEPMTEEHLH